MRVISQDGTIDIPYGTTALSVDKYNCVILAVIPGYEKSRVVATYSSLERISRAMEMLQKQYAKLSSLQTLITGTAEAFNPEKIDTFKDMFVFQFPSDTDIA